MFRGLWKGITKIVSWGLRKIGLIKKDVQEKLDDYGIDYVQPEIDDTILESFEEIDVSDMYDMIPDDEQIPMNLIIETDEKLSRNYLTKIELLWGDPENKELLSEYITIVHDKNITKNEIREMIDSLIHEYELDPLKEGKKVEDFKIAVVKHRRGTPE